MTTVTVIADLAQLALSDSGASTWPQDTVEAWVIEAIRDYGSHFHQTKTQTITCVADQHNYDLEDDVREILLVEYPVGEDPPEFLRRLSRKDPTFWTSDSDYDHEPSDAGSAAVGELWISADPVATETIKVTFRAEYYDPTASPADTAVYVPDFHIPILVLFVQWKAAVERLNFELQGPDYSNIAIGHIRGAVEMARDDYDGAIKGAKRATSRSRATDPWQADDYDRIY